VRLAGQDPAAVFGADRHAPPAVAADEGGRALAEASPAVRADLPDFVLPLVEASLGAEAGPVLEAMRRRAPVFLRVNAARIDREGAIAALADDRIAARPLPHVRTALEVVENARRLAQAPALLNGLVEVQDAHSQAVVEALGPVRGLRVLDYCAGAGGKALHLAAEGAEVTAHDADPRRMRDLAPRALRAGAAIAQAATGALQGLGPWPLVLVDAPCSGSGTWRRDPEAKWRLTAEALERLLALQADILDAAAVLVAPGGRLAWVTCSLLDAENGGQVAAFLDRAPGWSRERALRLLPGARGDGFGIAILRRASHS
jgi:16S rRNA (cytosine967-C5)-methyltransferase